MKVAFFSTNSNHFDGRKIATRNLPDCAEELDELCARHPECEFSVVAELPGKFLLDLDGNEVARKSKSVKYTIVEPSPDSIEEVARKVAAEKPDLAIAATGWTEPFDWLSVKDGMVAERLREIGIRTAAHPASASLDCFDKARTHFALERIGIPMAHWVHVHHWLFMCAGTKGRVRENVYADFVLERIRNLDFPVIIKDTVGLSSYGAEVVGDFSEAVRFLSSRRNSSDRIAEELLAGEQFGTEIHGTPGHYRILPPMMFSVNRYGITSPKQSVKVGPVMSEKYKIGELNGMLLKLAETLKLSGIAQVDLVFSGGKWFVIEVNPRLSGMTSTYAASMGKSVPELILESALPPKSAESQKFRKVLNFKMPVLTDEQMEAVRKERAVARVSRIENYAATQKREVGYTEVILAGETLAEVESVLDTLRIRFPGLVEDVFYDRARAILEKIVEIAEE